MADDVAVDDTNADGVAGGNVVTAVNATNLFV